MQLQKASLFPLKALLLRVVILHPESSTGFVRHTAGQSTSRQEHDYHIFTFPTFLKSHVRNRKAWKKTLQTLSINKQKKNSQRQRFCSYFLFKRFLCQRVTLMRRNSKSRGSVHMESLQQLLLLSRQLTSSNQKSKSVFHINHVCIPDLFTASRTSYIIQLAFGNKILILRKLLKEDTLRLQMWN